MLFKLNHILQAKNSDAYFTVVCKILLGILTSRKRYLPTTFHSAGSSLCRFFRGPSPSTAAIKAGPMAEGRHLRSTAPPSPSEAVIPRLSTWTGRLRRHDIVDPPEEAIFTSPSPSRLAAARRARRRAVRRPATLPAPSVLIVMPCLASEFLRCRGSPGKQEPSSHSEQ